MDLARLQDRVDWALRSEARAYVLVDGLNLAARQRYGGPSGVTVWTRDRARRVMRRASRPSASANGISDVGRAVWSREGAWGLMCGTCWTNASAANGVHKRGAVRSETRAFELVCWAGWPSHGARWLMGLAGRSDMRANCRGTGETWR